MQSVLTTQVIDNNSRFERPFPLEGKSDSMQPGSSQRMSPNRVPEYDSPQRQNSPNSSLGSPDRGMIHTRTNFGKTRCYVPPMVSSSPAGRQVPPDSPPVGRQSLSGGVANSPIQGQDDAPEDEARFQTVRSLRPKKSMVSSSRHSSDDSATHNVGAPPSPARRPEAYISETDESNLSFEPSPSPARNQETRHPSFEDEEPFDMASTLGKAEARHPSPIETSPIRPKSKAGMAESPRYRSAEEINELRRRRRLNKSKRMFEMPQMEDPPPVRVTTTKTSDLTDDTDLVADPMPSFDQEQDERMMESEMDYHQEDDSLPPPPESPRYEEFHQDRETPVSPQKTKPKSILRSKRTSSSPPTDDDDDSLFDFGGKNSALGKGTSVRKSSLKSGVTSSSNRRGRRSRRRSEDDGNDDDESLIQYGEHRQRSSSLQERTQEAWTFRSKRSFSASSPRKESQQAGVQFGNTDTVHHFDDQETVGTTGTLHSINSLYTKSPESEAEDLIKDLLLIGSGEHSHPGRRKLKYQPDYKRQLRKEKVDERSIDDNTLGTTDISLNTLEYATGHREFSAAVTKARGEGLKPDAPQQSDTQSKSVRGEAVDSNAGGVDAEKDPLSMVWGYVESGMKALGLASTPPMPNETETEHTEKKVADVNSKLAMKMNMVGEDKLRSPSANEEVPFDMKFSVVAGVGSSGTERSSFPADEVKAGGIGSFNEVMEYMFGDASKKEEKQKNEDKKSHASSAGSVAGTSVSLEEDPRLEDLAMHAVRSKHQVFDMVFDENATVNVEKDIKFSLVKTKLPLGILFHENDGGCWITKVFPDGNAAKAGGVEVGDQLAAINGMSAIQLRVDQICTLITEAPDPENIELTFLRYSGQLHPAVTPDLEEVVQESFEVTDGDALTKPPMKKSSRSLRPLSKLRSRDPSPKPSTKSFNALKSPKAEAKGKKGIGKWFGKGKKKSPAV